MNANPSVGTAEHEAVHQTVRHRHLVSVPWYRSQLFDVAVFAALAIGLLCLTFAGALGMGYAWQWQKIPRYLYRVVDGEFRPGPLLKGLVVTLNLSAVSMLLAMAIGLAAALLRLSPSVVGRAVARAYVELIRNTPMLIQILIIYFIIAKIFGISRFWSGALCLALYEGAFAAEIIRGAINAIPRGQMEASKSLGLSTYHAYRDVILPQALPLILPPMAGVVVNLVKHSAIVSVIAVFDLATEARTAIADSFLAFEIWLVTAGLYLTITIALSLVANVVERHYRRNRLK